LWLVVILNAPASAATRRNWTGIKERLLEVENQFELKMPFARRRFEFP